MRSRGHIAGGVDIGWEEDHKLAGLDGDPVLSRDMRKCDILFRVEGDDIREGLEGLPSHHFDAAERDLDIDVFPMVFGGDLVTVSAFDFLDIGEGLAVGQDFVPSELQISQVSFF